MRKSTDAQRITPSAGSHCLSMLVAMLLSDPFDPCASHLLSSFHSPPTDRIGGGSKEEPCTRFTLLGVCKAQGVRTGKPAIEFRVNSELVAVK